MPRTMHDRDARARRPPIDRILVRDPAPALHGHYRRADPHVKLASLATASYTRIDPALAQAFTGPEGIPAIQVGPSEGKLLELLVRLVRAEKIVEVGTLIGYSAIHLARALPANGRLWTIEFDPKHAEVARANIDKAGL